jgi:hypothetical protein
MPPRRSARVAAVVERESSALSPLPLAVVLHIFSLLPVDVRARAACVCRGWCHVLLERSLWTRLDLSPSSGVRVRVTDAVLSGAAAKARGGLQTLDVFGCEYLTPREVLGVIISNRGALRDLCIGGPPFSTQMLSAKTLESIVHALPDVACNAYCSDVATTVADSRRMLRNEPPFERLRLRGLCVNFERNGAAAAALVADIAAHASLKSLFLANAALSTIAALDPVVDALLACSVPSVTFLECRLMPETLPAVARLLGSTALTDLSIHVLIGPWLLGAPGNAPGAVLLAAALRANTTIISLELKHVHFWWDIDAATTLLGALTSHASLRTLHLDDFLVMHEDAAHAAAAGAALNALIAANAPALQKLSIPCIRNRAVLGPLLEALPANTHLRTLNIAWNYMGAAFARDVLLPAVRANTSLRKLGWADDPIQCQNPYVQEAVALVAARNDAAAGN